MKWILAGLSFACAIGLAIGTAALRAENVRLRRAIEVQYRDVQDRIVEVRRLQKEALEFATPERLAEAHWRLLTGEVARRREQLQ
jgi:uncharacterized membrane-anchored protein YhcB (DUF1043 family)